MDLDLDVVVDLDLDLVVNLVAVVVVFLDAGPGHPHAQMKRQAPINTSYQEPRPGRPRIHPSRGALC